MNDVKYASIGYGLDGGATGFADCALRFTRMEGRLPRTITLR